MILAVVSVNPPILSKKDLQKEPPKGKLRTVIMFCNTVNRIAAPRPHKMGRTPRAVLPENFRDAPVENSDVGLRSNARAGSVTFIGYDLTVGACSQATIALQSRVNSLLQFASLENVERRPYRRLFGVSARAQRLGQFSRFVSEPSPSPSCDLGRYYYARLQFDPLVVRLGP